MLPELTKITAVHCEHLSIHLVAGDSREDALVIAGYYHPSTHLVTGDGREDALVRPGYYHLNPPGSWRQPRGRPRQTWLLSSLNPPSNWRQPRGRPRQTWLPTVSDDLQHLNRGLRLAYRQAQDRPVYGRRPWKQLRSRSDDDDVQIWSLDVAVWCYSCL